MKRTTLVIAAILLSVIAMGQKEQYYQKMGETLEKYAECSTVEEYQDLANQFSVIARVETEEWLPLYYEAHCYILMAFISQRGSGNPDGYLNKASVSIDKMMELAPEEAEIYVMKAFYHTGYLVVDPPTRAMSTQPLINAALTQALSLDPSNPRATFLRISNEMGTASFFGSDTAPMCKDATSLLESWDDYKVKSPIHPNWGKAETKGIVQGCTK